MTVLHFDVFTLFPGMFSGPLTESILGRAQKSGVLSVTLHNVRDYATDKHMITDEPPYGGGGGMILKAEPLVTAVEAVLAGASASGEKVPVILLTPQGRVFNQKCAKELANHQRVVLICGHYEGLDERARELVVTDEISIGDYVLTGGELPAMILIDAAARYLPGVLGEEGAADDDSHATGLLEQALYTRPLEYRGLRVPSALLSGNHAEIERWRRRDSIRRTWQRRPDLLLRAVLSEDERYFLAQLANADAATP